MIVRHAGKVLSGIRELKGSLEGLPAVVCGSGPTLRGFSSRNIPDSWPIVAVNEAIGKLQSAATFWVLSDTPIVEEYSAKCPADVTILAMHNATWSIERACPKNKIYTVQSRREVEDFNDGCNFFSRGTVLIGAIEMLRYMSCNEVYCFGLDLFRNKDRYYYDDRTPRVNSERDVRKSVTPRLQKMIDKLKEAESLWQGMKIYCVGSPDSRQESFSNIRLEEFLERAWPK